MTGFLAFRIVLEFFVVLAPQIQTSSKKNTKPGVSKGCCLAGT